LKFESDTGISQIFAEVAVSRESPRYCKHPIETRQARYGILKIIERRLAGKITCIFGLRRIVRPKQQKTKKGIEDPYNVIRQPGNHKGEKEGNLLLFFRILGDFKRGVLLER
jgi:hypothetical protein